VFVAAYGEACTPPMCTRPDRDVSREIELYNLDVIISIGYRVKSHRGTQFGSGRPSGCASTSSKSGFNAFCRDRHLAPDGVRFHASASIDIWHTTTSSHRPAGRQLHGRARKHPFVTYALCPMRYAVHGTAYRVILQGTRARSDSFAADDCMHVVGRQRTRRLGNRSSVRRFACLLAIGSLHGSVLPCQLDHGW
jgi:hypothetical protein